MRFSKYMMTAVVILLFFSASAFAQNLVVFPAQGQSAEQQKQDEYDCYQWAKQNTGFDPALTPPPQASSAPPESGKKGVDPVTGAIIGGAGGAGVGALTAKKGKRDDHAWKGALIGAGAGALFGKVTQDSAEKKQREERERWEQQQASQAQYYNQQRDAFNRSYGACLESKGYTVR